ncbi:inclusion body family protein [Paraherbaspirillum soli]|uniref:Inclusion body family protein n=1 Tax=Paraherbaspirillum soli TaxID=631222 RepID=A0ABW0MCT1_9BURK
MSEITLAASSQAINVFVVIDTEKIKNGGYPVSKDKTKPVGIRHDSQYMLVTGARQVISGQGTADLNFRANAGDTVSFTGTSFYDNADDAVIVYGIQYWKGDQVFNRFVPNLVTRTGAVEPNTETDDGLPAKKTKFNFSSFDSKVRSSGTEDFYVLIALYTLAPNGQDQELHGYYYWDPTITVS